MNIIKCCFGVTCCQLWFTCCDRRQPCVVNATQQSHSSMASVPINRAEHIMKCVHDKIDGVPQKHITWRLNKRKSLCLYGRICIWNSRTHTGSALRIQITSDQPLFTKTKRSSKRSHWKAYKLVQARIYYSCVELSIFVGKDSLEPTFSFQTPHNYVVVAKQMAPVRWSSINTLYLPHKVRWACSW